MEGAQEIFIVDKQEEQQEQKAQGSWRYVQGMENSPVWQKLGGLHEEVTCIEYGQGGDWQSS